MLDIKDIEARVINLEDMIRGEQDENTIRKDFTMSERQALKAAIEPRLREKAKERQGQRTDLIPSAESAEGMGEARKKVASILGVSHAKMKQEDMIMAYNDPEIIGQVDSGKLSTDAAFKEVKQQKKKVEIQTAQKKVANEYEEKTTPLVILQQDHANYNSPCDLLITDPPYMTDVEDISEFVKWLPKKLECVKDTGFAFVFIGAYPEELKAYLGISMPTQVLVWTYRNTLGVTPKNIYKLNWQVILFYRMKNSPQLNCPLTNEQWAVQDYNAPDGRHGERYHAWEKPMKLAEALIRHTTKKGDTIFDCFAGTGTFLLAASKLGRKSIGCEIDNDMVKIAIDRGCQLG